MLNNEKTQGDALAIRPNLLAAFDGVSSYEEKGENAKEEFLKILDTGKSIPKTIEELIKQQRYYTTLALATLTPENRLEIYQIGDSTVRIYNQEGSLIYQTTEQNLMGDIKKKLGLVKGFYERPVEEIFSDVQMFPEIRRRLTKICDEFMSAEGFPPIFDPITTQHLLKIMGKTDLYETCINEIQIHGYSITLLRLLYENAGNFVSYCLADQESLEFSKPVKTLEAKPGYRIMVGTDGVFGHVREDDIKSFAKSSRRFASRALAYEAQRKTRGRVDASSIVADLVFS